MIGKKISVIFSFVLSTCLAVLLISASSSAFCSEENEDIFFYDASQRTAELAMHAMSAIDADYKLGGNSP